jgi:exoribonuclease R
MLHTYADVIVHRLLAASIGVEPISQDVDNNKVCFKANHPFRS